MGKTHTKKVEKREQSLQGLSGAERATKLAAIKRKEGRVLDANEKHALQMQGALGQILHSWEKLKAAALEVERLGPGAGDAVAAAEEKVAGLVDIVWGLVASDFKSYARSARASRVIQSCVKLGDNDQRLTVVQALAADSAAFAELCGDKYAHHIVLGLFRHGTPPVFAALLPLVAAATTKIVSHKFGVSVLHAAYASKLASAQQRHLLVLGVFKDSVAVMKQWKGYPVLEAMLREEPAQRPRLVAALGKIVAKAVSQKDVVEHAYVQRLLAAFFAFGPKDELSELAVDLKLRLGALTESPEGAALACQVFAVLEPRQRKEALAQFVVSGALAARAGTKHGAPFVARLLDLSYDRQIADKYLLNALASHIAPLASSPYGHMILLHLLTPEAERKRRALLPTWLVPAVNLFSRGNPAWSHVTWHTTEGAEETVEVCKGSDAADLHCHALAALLPALLPALPKDADAAEAKPAATAAVGADGSVPRLFAGRVAKEAIHLIDTGVAPYAAALQKALGAAGVAALRAVLPKKELRAREDGADEGDDDEAAAAAAAAAAKAAKAAKPAAKAGAIPAKRSAAAEAPAPAKEARRVASRPSEEDPDAPVETVIARVAPGGARNGTAAPPAKKRRV